MPLLFRVLIGLGLLGTCGCNLNYYWHLARGQSRVVYNRIPVQTLLARADLAAQTRTQLELIQAILRYAESVGLKTDDQYTTFYDTGGDPISWNVSACPPDRFSPYTWDFPFVGEVPYKGFFRRDLADEQRDALAAAGYDAIVRPVSAYSTLGIFSDPILSPMLGYAPDQLADLNPPRVDSRPCLCPRADRLQRELGDLRRPPRVPTLLGATLRHRYPALTTGRGPPSGCGSLSELHG